MYIKKCKEGVNEKMKLTPKKEKNFTFRLEEKDFNLIKDYANTLGMSTSQFIRLLLKTTCIAVEKEKSKNDNDKINNNN